MPATEADHRSAAAIAAGAGELLVELRENLERLNIHPRTTRDEGDRRSHEYIMDALAREHPDDAVLSEEGVDDPARLAAPRVWIVDPLDGTREFRERGRIDWAVHVALSVGGAPAVGAVALPALDIVLSTGAPPDLQPPTGEPPRLVVSRSRPPEVAYDVAEALGAVMVPLGSAGAKIAAVILGDAEVYVHAGGQYEWDSCAPAAVALASGLHASRLDGSPLRYGDPDAWLPDLVVCRPEYASAVLDVTTRQRRPNW